METILQNMCMIYDRDNDKILILDKVKKYGWEGLTFVGGHVEKGEVLYDSCVREVFARIGVKPKTNAEIIVKIIPLIKFITTS